MNKINYQWNGVFFLNNKWFRESVFENDENYPIILEIIEDMRPELLFVCNSVYNESINTDDLNIVEPHLPLMFLINKDEYFITFKNNHDEAFILYSSCENVQMFINYDILETLEYPGILKCVKILNWYQTQSKYHDNIIVNHTKRNIPENQSECSVFNLSGYPISIVNRMHGKTVIHDEPFPVIGFWRKQRVGKGRSIVKEVFINSYVKQGYTRTY